MAYLPFVDVILEANGVEELERHDALGRLAEHIANDVDRRVDVDVAACEGGGWRVRLLRRLGSL